MSTWNYRIVKVEDGYALHEVHYNSAGEIWGMTQDPEVVGDTPEEIIDELMNMLVDAKALPVMDMPTEWAKPDFDTNPDPARCHPLKELLDELEARKEDN